MQETNTHVARPVSSGMDGLLGKKFPILDDGFIRVVDYMGNDDSIVQAARVSYGTGTKRLNADRALVRYLMRHEHTTPFEMCEIKLHVRAPMDCWRQWIRHRTASVNEYSTRYSLAIDSMQKTPPNGWRRQSAANRQGSDAFLEVQQGATLSESEARLQSVCTDIYQERIGLGVAREQARKDLPLSTYTEAYWKIDLHNLLHFLRLRMDARAQEEIRRYATVIGEEIVAKWCPLVWEAFVQYRLQNLNLSHLETEIVSLVATGRLKVATERAEAAGMLLYRDGGLEKNRERNELEDKLRRLNLPIPWQSPVREP